MTWREREEQNLHQEQREMSSPQTMGQHGQSSEPDSESLGRPLWWHSYRASQETWKARNRDYYLEQKRRLANRPEYRAHRKQVDAQKKAEARAGI